MTTFPLRMKTNDLFQFDPFVKHLCRSDMFVNSRQDLIQCFILVLPTWGIDNDMLMHSVPRLQGDILYISVHNACSPILTENCSSPFQLLSSHFWPKLLLPRERLHSVIAYFHNHGYDYGFKMG